VKKRCLILRECKTKIVRAYALKPGKSVFADTGEWMLRTLADLERRCAKKGVKPCLHLEAQTLTLMEIDALNRTEWQNDLEEITQNVERNQRGAA